MSHEARAPTVAQLSKLVGIMRNQDRILGYRGRDIVVLCPKFGLTNFRKCAKVSEMIFSVRIFIYH